MVAVTWPGRVEGGAGVEGSDRAGVGVGGSGNA